jgi:trigger factor
VAKLADAPDLGSGGAIRVGSTPSARTYLVQGSKFKVKLNFEPCIFNFDLISMEITKEAVTELTAIITINLKPEDYRPGVDKMLKKYQHSAQVPGFRPGKVPVGMIKKMYGKSVLVEEINQIIGEAISKYLYENNIHTMGNPLPLKQDVSPAFEDGENFKFQFEIGLAPKVEIDAQSISAIPYYLIKVDDKMVDDDIKDIRRKYGKYSNPEVSEENHILYGEFEELDETGNVKEGGNKTTTTMVIELIKDAEHRAPFIGLKKDDSVVFNPMEAMNHEAEVAAMLKAEKGSPAMEADYKFTVKSINQIDQAELNQDFFDKIYGEAVVHDEEGFRSKIREGIVGYFESMSFNKLKKDIKRKFLEEINIPLPDDFLKRMVKETAEKTEDEKEHDFEHEYYHLAEELRWSLIRNKIATENNLTVTEDEVKAVAKAMARDQFAQYGYYDMPPDKIEEVAKSYYSGDGDVAARMERSILDEKVFTVLKTKVNLDMIEMPYAEFIQKLNEKTEHELEHHHEH